MVKNIDQTRPVVGGGSNVVDIIYHVNQIAKGDEKTYIVPNEQGLTVSERPGGVTLNHLAWSSLLGVPTGLFGFQGDDQYGNIIRDEMDRHRIERSAILIRKGYLSSFSVVNVSEDGERAIYMSRGLTAETTPEDIEKYFADYISSASIVTTEISQFPLDTVLSVLQIAREAGAMTVLDVDVSIDFAVEVARLGSREQLEQALKLADVLKASQTPASQILEFSGEIEKQAEGIFERYNPCLVAITGGIQGSILTDGIQTIRSSPKPVEVYDTTGAGDAFLGGIIAGIYHGLNLESIADLAESSGASCCCVPGAFPQLEASRKDVLNLYGGTPLPIKLSPAPERDESLFFSNHPKEKSTTPVGLKLILQTAESLTNLHRSMSNNYYDDAITLIRKAENLGNRVHVTGVGKSRHIGHKLTATFQSTGTKAYFLDPTDCNHGDSGQIEDGDIVIALSHSGESVELIDAIRTVLANGAIAISITGNESSTLASLSTVVLVVPVTDEAGPLGVAPTVSTSCHLAVADGLAMALMAERGFTKKDFARYHPGGSIGKKLKYSEGES